MAIFLQLGQEPVPNELLVLMKSTNIDDLHEKFRSKGITSKSLWKLTDDYLTNDLQLTALQKLRYDSAKENRFDLL